MFKKEIKKEDILEDFDDLDLDFDNTKLKSKVEEKTEKKDKDELILQKYKDSLEYRKKYNKEKYVNKTISFSKDEYKQILEKLNLKEDKNISRMLKEIIFEKLEIRK